MHRAAPGSWLILAVLGCASPPPAPPTAVIDATPSEVCVGDRFATPITLSGARSAGRLSLVPAPPDPSMPLDFAWELEGDAHELVAGRLDGPELTVRMAGARPLHVTLRVTSFEGGVAESLRTIGIVVPLTPGCEEGCPQGSSCVVVRDRSLCLPDAPCASDDECSACLVCDANLGRCAPPPEAP